jgi:hypothetical protein
VLGVVAGVRWGALGVAVGYTAASMLTSPPSLAFAASLVDLRLADLWRHLRGVFAAGGAMLGVVVPLGAWAPPGLPLLGLLAAQVAAGALVYGAVVALLRVPPYRDLLALLRGAPRLATDTE